MLSNEEILALETSGPNGTTHFVADGKRIYASYFPEAKLTCKVYPDDEPGGPVFVSHTGPVAIVYASFPLALGEGDSFEDWIQHGELRSFYGHCAINGLLFYSDLVSWDGFNVVQFPSSHTTWYDYGDDLHELAKEIILRMTGTEWDEDFLNRTVKSQASDFLTKHFMWRD